MITNELEIIALLFDTGKINDCFYGNVVFERIIEGKEIVHNSHKIVVSVGDILQREINDDIRPFLIKNDINTTNLEQSQSRSVIYAVVLEDIQTSTARLIDARLRQNFPAYLGMTEININSTDTRKQFWKTLIRYYSIEANTITVFGTEEENVFNYLEIANEYGFRVNYDGFPIECHGEGKEQLFSTRQSTFVNCLRQLEHVDGPNDSDRGRLEMNFALVKEVEIAGVMVWKAIEDINLVDIPSGNSDFAVTDYIYTSLYQASQGVERLLKIAIELIMYTNNDATEKRNAESLLLGHNHPELAKFIEEHEEHFQLNKSSRHFLWVLRDFYKVARYGRFRYNENQTIELELFQSLGLNENDSDFSEKTKHIYGKRLGHIAQSLYSLIDKISTRLNIYVYELNSDSVANFSLRSYFGEDLYETFQRIQQAKREFLWYLMQHGTISSHKKILESFPPLPFDEGDLDEFFKSLIDSGYSSDLLFDFVDCEYDELVGKDKTQWKERVEIIKLLFSNHFNLFDEDDDCDEE
ncbi:MAG: hypothetical protein LBN04_05220 [Oscillospiraceae bacterium]|nr:hypothetical protein [Oscillospiraceae bacterium]